MLDNSNPRVSARLHLSQSLAAVLLLVSLFGSREAGAVCPPFPTGVSFGPGSTLNFDGSGGIVGLSLVVDPTCGTWTATSGAGWMTIISAASGVGDATVGVSVDVNTGPPRSDYIYVSIPGWGGTITQYVTQDTCTTVLTPASANVGYAGATGLNLNATYGQFCPFTGFVSNDAWITLTGGSGVSGSMNTTYDVAANPGPARVGSITANGQIFTVNQADGCAANTALNPTNAAPPATGATGQTFQVQVAAGCPWTAISNDPWLTITAGSPGLGTGTVTYDVAANVDPARIGTITAGGQTFTVTQDDGCAMNSVLIPVSASIPAAAAINQPFDVQTGVACPWPTVISNDFWITLGSEWTAGDGVYHEVFNVTANVGPARIGTITANGHIFTVYQADGCAANTTLVPTNAAPPATGAIGQTFQIQAAGGCAWTAVSNAPWITVTAGSPGLGTGTVTYDVATNVGPARIGTITAGGQTFTVNQADGCAANTSLNPTNAAPPATGAIGQTFQVQVAAGCPWTATPVDPWITVTAGSPGLGTGTVTYDVATNVGPARIGTITAGGQTFTVNQADGCAANTSLNPTGVSLPWTLASSQTFQVQVAGGCAWTAVSNDPWITITAGAAGTGTATVTYDVATNIGPARIGTVTAGGQTFTINQASGCVANTSLNPPSANIGNFGSFGQTFQVQTPATCPWTAVPAVAWITITAGASGLGPGTTTFNVEANAGPARAGTVSAGGLTFTVNQSDGCGANTILDPPSGSAPATGATGLSFQLVTSPGCAWTVTPNAPWITITSTPSGNGTGTITCDVAANPGPSRVGSITAGGQSFLLSQSDGCAGNTNLDPASATFPASGATAQSFQVQASPGCPWVATSNVDWLTLTSGTAGSGTAPVTFDVAVNPGPARTGTITASGLAFTVNQADGCAASMTLIPAGASLPPSGATGQSFQVQAAPGCPWTATANDPWITVTSGSAGSGPGIVMFDVAPNGGPARLGTITVAGRTFTVNQGEGCTLSTTLDPANTTLPASGSTGQTFQIHAAAGCTWTVTSNHSWIAAISGSSGSGPGTVTFDVAPNAGPARMGTITAAGLTFTVSQEDGCGGSTTLNPISATVGPDGASGQFFQVLTATDCAWTAIADNDWITITAGASGSGTGTVTFDAAENAGPERTGTITAAGLAFTVNQGSGCGSSTTLNPISATVGPDGASGQSFQVQTATGCPWTAISNDSWISIISGAAGSGAGTVAFGATANTGPSRTGTITAGGQTFTVLQADGCSGSTSLSPVSASIAAAGATGQSFQVETAVGCPWSAASSASWITITSDLSGTGPGHITFDIQLNPGPARSGIVTVASQTFTVSQADGCAENTALDPERADILAIGAPVQTFRVQTTAGCPWTVASNDSWITISGGGSGTGTETVTYSVAANAGPARAGTISAGGQPFTVNQADGCAENTAVSPTAVTLPAAGAAGLTFQVLSEPGCAWTAVSNAGWVTVVSGGSGTQAGTITYSVSSNLGPARTATISVRGEIFTVNQDGGCGEGTNLEPTDMDVPAAGGFALSFQVQTGAGCPWTATSNAAWLTVSSASSHSGPGTVTFNVLANAGPARTGTVTASGETFTVYQAEPCGARITLSPDSASVPSAATTGLAFEIQAATGCRWTARSNSAWIAIVTGTSGTGNGSVVFSVAANTGPARTGTITAGGETFWVSQADGCSAGTTFSPSSATLATGGAVGRSFQVIVASGCPWTAATGTTWITLTSGTAGTGNGAVTYNVSANTGPSRTGTINVGDRAFTVQQSDGCASNTGLAPPSANVVASGAAGQTVEVRTGTGCPWTANSNNGWISIVSGSSGNGNGLVTYDVAANSGPSRSGTITAAGRILTINQADICASSTTVNPVSVNLPADTSNQTFQVQAPPGCSWSATTGVPWIAVTSGSGNGNGTVTYSVAANAGDARTGTVLVSGRAFTVAQARWCGRPATPLFTSYPTAPVIAGNSFTLGWEAVGNLPPSGFYQVSISNNAECASPTTITTTELFVTIPTVASETVTYCAQVRAVAGEDCAPAEYVSDPSTVVTVHSRPLPPAFTVIQGLFPLPRADRNAPPPTGSTVVFRNVGDSSGTLSLAFSGGFFSISPSTLPEVAPGDDAIVTIIFAADSTDTAGVKNGDLVGTWSTNDGVQSVSTAVTLSVLEGTAQSTAGVRLEAIGSTLVYFRQYSGNPAPRQIIVRNSGFLPVRIAPSIGPGGTWLSVLGEFASPLQPLSERYFDLIVDRTSRTSEDGPPPLSTTLRIENVDGNPEDAAIFTVFDEEPVPPVTGTNRPEENASLILGSSVSTTSAASAASKRHFTSAPEGNQYFSDGWIRNRGSDPVSVDLYFTPEGAEGRTDSRVRKSTISVHGYSAFRVSDFLKGLFDLTGSGHVEIRSDRLSQLSVRATVESIGFKDGVSTQFGCDQPVLMAGQGIGVSGEGEPRERLVLSGLRGPLSGHRTNVIFAETSGSTLAVKARLFDSSGLLLGQKTVTVKPFSKTQVNSGDPDLFPVPYQGGTLEIEPAAGGGTVSAFATVLDNSSQSYSMRLGTVIAETRTAQKALLSTSTGYLPAVVQEKTADAFYTTRVTITNGSGSDARVQVTYLPDPGFGEPVEPVSVVVPSRDTANADAGPRALVFEEVLKDLLKIQDGSRGMLKFEGELGDLTFTTETATPLDLENPELGRSLSSVNPAPGADPTFPGVFSVSSQEILGEKQSDSDTAKAEVSLPAIEENSQFRTNLILAELGGEKGKVKVLLRKAGGATLGDPLVVELGPNERKQIDRIILAVVKPPSGVADFKDVEIVVQAVEGKSRTLALVAKIATDPKSKRIDTYVLGPSISGNAKRGGKK